MLSELRGSAGTTELDGLPVRTVQHRAAEPIGVPALLELAAELYADDDPLAIGGEGERPLLEVSGGGRGLDAEFELRIAVPLTDDADLDLARVDDELAITVDGRRRLVALPAALRRCVVTGAEVDARGLAVRLRPDPELWLR